MTPQEEAEEKKKAQQRRQDLINAVMQKGVKAFGTELDETKKKLVEDYRKEMRKHSGLMQMLNELNQKRSELQTEIVKTKGKLELLQELVIDDVPLLENIIGGDITKVVKPEAPNPDDFPEVPPNGDTSQTHPLAAKEA